MSIFNVAFLRERRKLFSFPFVLSLIAGIYVDNSERLENAEVSKL